MDKVVIDLNGIGFEVLHIPMKQHNRPEGTARCSVSNGITAE